MQRASMAGLLQPPRSRFMINDILSGGGGNGGPSDGRHPGPMGLSDDGRSLSPQPRDLSVSMSGGNMHHGSHNLDDSDSDSSGGMDDHSMSSNGKCCTAIYKYKNSTDGR